MQLVRDTWESIAALWAEWGDLYLDRLIFSQQSVAQQLLIALIGLAAIFVVIRSFGGRNPANRRMALPAIVSKPGWSRASLSRHGALMLALALTALAEDWPKFLGPRGDNTSLETGLLEKFPTNGVPVLWEKKVGTGYSAPSIYAAQLVLHHRVVAEKLV